MSRALVVFALFLAALLLLKPTTAASRAPGWMGIVVSDLTPDQCRAFGVKRGVQVVDVEPGGPADRKDIEEGDLIVTYEDQPVRSAAWLMGRIRRDGEGFLASVHYLRDGQDHWAGLVTLAAAPPPPPSPPTFRRASQIWNAGWTRSREEWRSSNSARVGTRLAE